MPGTALGSSVTQLLRASQSLALPNQPAQGLPGCAAAPAPPDEPAVSHVHPTNPRIFGLEQDSRELTVPGLSPAQHPPTTTTRPKRDPGILPAAPTHPQGPRGCQPVPMAPTHTPQGCPPAPACLPVCCHGDQRCGDRRGWSLAPRQGCSYTQRGQPPPSLSCSPLPPGLGRGPSVKPLPQAARWGCPICSAVAPALLGTAAVPSASRVRDGDSATPLPPDPTSNRRPLGSTLFLKPGCALRQTNSSY